MLAQILRRLRACSSLDEIVIATSVSASDDPIAALGVPRAFGVPGSEADVLHRMCSRPSRRADVVVRVTGDCPLIDPVVTDRVVNELITHANSADYASNVLRRTYPRGLDVWPSSWIP